MAVNLIFNAGLVYSCKAVLLYRCYVLIKKLLSFLRLVFESSFIVLNIILFYNSLQSFLYFVALTSFAINLFKLIWIL